jgi:hypothetical protein
MDNNQRTAKDHEQSMAMINFFDETIKQKMDEIKQMLQSDEKYRIATRYRIMEHYKKKMKVSDKRHKKHIDNFNHNIILEANEKLKKFDNEYPISKFDYNNYKSYFRNY